MILPTLTLEKSLWAKGYEIVAGVDEAGKGPLAGPVTAGAVVIESPKQRVKGVRDSKLMTHMQREKAYEQITKLSLAYGIGIVDNIDIDLLGIEYAVKKAMMIALSEVEKNFGLSISYVIVDGSRTKILDNYPSQRILKGGLHHYSIAAASILAKVTRDKLMQDYAKKYPEYGFGDHVGYGTKEHLTNLQRFGPCTIHRKSFKPVFSATSHLP